jgi:hypothetical protein
MIIYIACNHDHRMPSHLMHLLHYHLHICIITGLQESVAAEPEAAEEVPQKELTQEV